MKSFLLGVCSFVIVAFGQPVWSQGLSVAASIFGYALFWPILLNQSQPSRKFLLGCLWGTGVQLVQLSWLLTHPYWYIVGVHVGLSLMVGLQVGLLSLLITEKRLARVYSLLPIAALWTLMEWIRLFFLAGFSLNPAGLALSAHVYPLQLASLWGVYGLTFWVIFVNLFVLHIWVGGFSWAKGGSLLALIAFPWIYGGVSLHYHQRQTKPPPFHVVLVQTAFPAEEGQQFSSHEQLVAYILDEWKQIYSLVKKHLDRSLDLIVLPEGTVPLGTYNFVYDHQQVKEMVASVFGDVTLPALGYPWEMSGKVSNAFLAKVLAHLCDAGVVVGLEDASDHYDKKRGDRRRKYYSTAQYFQPGAEFPMRYAKRVLVPMGEYIPFSFLKSLCARYGVCGSMTPGESAKVMRRDHTPFGLSICYEETFGHLTRENRQQGAQLLVNLTNDVWYPDSTLPQVHFDHAKLRTVENGMPLVRACNTGVTAVVDALGRNVSILGQGEQRQQWISDALYAAVPMYTYTTVYTVLGDGLIVGLSLLVITCFFVFELVAAFSRRSLRAVSHFQKQPNCSP